MVQLSYENAIILFQQDYMHMNTDSNIIRAMMLEKYTQCISFRWIISKGIACRMPMASLIYIVLVMMALT